MRYKSLYVCDVCGREFRSKDDVLKCEASCGVNIFIPSQTTIEKMIIAQNVTYERVEQAADTVTDVYNDIMDLFRESKDVDQ